MTDLTATICGIGAYIPRYRLSAETVTDAWGQFHGAGISETSVPAADEDTLTMAVEAATAALSASETDPEAIDGVYLGTTTPPTEEEAIGPRLASMLGLDEAVRTRQLTGSTRAGVDAFVSAARAVEDGAAVLAIGTDIPRGEPDDEIDHAAGAGATAVVIEGSAASSLESVAEQVSARPGTRFREAGERVTTGLGVTAYDRAAFIETVAAAAESIQMEPATADAVALQSPNGKLPYRTTDALGVDSETIQRGTVVHDIGDTGAASPLLGLASARDSGATQVVVIGYGSGGGATAVALDCTDVPVEWIDAGQDGETAQLTYSEYLRQRGEITPGEPDGGGAYVSVPSWRRTIPQRHRLRAGRCPDCGALSFPPEGACDDCSQLVDYEHISLEGTGTIEALTVIGQGGAPPEFVEQQARSGSYVSSVVALDGPEGQTVSVPAQVVGIDPAAVEIGDRVEATMRRIYTQEGVTRYGFKMRPLSD